MNISTRQVKSILTPQRKGFLASAPFPFTHSLSPYTGCGFGKSSCGTFCYAQFMPNWTNFRHGEAWGELVGVKENAGIVLEETLRSMSHTERANLRIFMASTTDPYQPLEAKYRVTQRCLDAFSLYSDIDLLVIQTRSPLVAHDFDRIQSIPYAWLSVTIETDNAKIIRHLGGGPAIEKRFEIVQQAAQAGIPVQIVVSPCLLYTSNFAERLVVSGARRIVVDDFTEGDGSGGKRTSNSPFATIVNYDWRDNKPARALYEKLLCSSLEIGWSATGFCGIDTKRLKQQSFLP